LSARHLAIGERIGNLLSHPAFKGFAPLILPWDDRGYDPEMRLYQIAWLLPYRSKVKPDVAVAGLNRMIEDIAAGHQVFFDIYSEEEKRSDPSKARAALFFFRGPPDAPFAMIAPEAGLPMSVRFTRAFPTRTRSTPADTTPSSSDTGRALAAGQPPKTWLRQSPLCSVTPEGLA